MWTKTLLLVACFGVALAASEWEDCGPENRSIIIHNIYVKPDPKLAEGEEIKVDTDLEVKTPLDEDVSVVIIINRKVKFVNPPIYLKKWGLCDLMSKSRIATFTQEMFNKKESDPCLVTPGRYTNSFVRKVDMNNLKLPDLAIKYGSGVYGTQLTFRKNDQIIGCARLRNVQVYFK